MQIQIEITDKPVIDKIKKLHSKSCLVWEDIWGSFSISFSGKEIFKDDLFLFFEFYNAIRYWETHKNEDFIYDAIDAPEVNPSIAFIRNENIFKFVKWADKTDIIISEKELEEFCMEFKERLKNVLCSINEQLTDEIVFALLKQLETSYRFIYR